MAIDSFFLVDQASIDDVSSKFTLVVVPNAVGCNGTVKKVLNKLGKKVKRNKNTKTGN